MPASKISFVIPVFNESANIRPLYQELSAVTAKLNYTFEFIFVDDGSSDDSLEVIRILGSEDKRVFYVELSRNFGQQYALKAGMDISKGDCVVSMDCDLQHPPQMVAQLIARWEEGYDVVYTKRLTDKSYPWLKRKTSSMFYRILNISSDTQLEFGVADFRLLDRKVVTALSGLTESGIFLRGLVKWVGFRQIGVEYYARDRFSGTSKYSFRKMMTFALQGLLSFSTRPLFFVLYTGIFMSVILFGLLAYLAVSYWLTNVVSQFALIAGAVMFFFSLQLVMIGIVSIYMSRVVTEVRQRPLYLVRDTNYNRPKECL